MKLTRKNNKNRSNHTGNDGWEEYNFSTSGMFDDFFTRDFYKPSFGNTGVTTPAVNIIETSDEFRMEMVAPGMNKEAFNVALDENTLTVSYDHEDNRQGERQNLKYVIREYNYHSFSRSFSLPETADAEKIRAKYQDGILNITIPKRAEARGNPARRIRIS
jgi:HSP20 family protein